MNHDHDTIRATRRPGGASPVVVLALFTCLLPAGAPLLAGGVAIAVGGPHVAFGVRVDHGMPYAPHYRGPLGAIDFDVEPEEARIYVDGQLVGQADDYDGFPTFLWLPPDDYDVVIYHPGYETIARRFEVRPDRVIEVDDEMRRGRAVPPDELGRSGGPQAEPMAPPRVERTPSPRVEPTPAPRVEVAPAPRVEREAVVEIRASDPGRIRFEVSPPDASIYLDGRFLGTADELLRLHAPLVVEPGPHLLEVVRPGYVESRETILIEAGDHRVVEIDLPLE